MSTIDPQDQPFSVLDSSAIIAWLRRERGWETVEAFLPFGIINTVNWTEVVQRITMPDVNLDPAQARAVLEEIGLIITDFTLEDSELAGQLFAPTRAAGLSLADRGCLATARNVGLPAVTGEEDWLRVDVGVRVILFRSRTATP